MIAGDRLPAWITPPKNYNPFYYSTVPAATGAAETTIGSFRTGPRPLRLATIQASQVHSANTARVRLIGRGLGGFADFFPAGIDRWHGSSIFAILPPWTDVEVRAVSIGATDGGIRLTGWHFDESELAHEYARPMVRPWIAPVNLSGRVATVANGTVELASWPAGRAGILVPELFALNYGTFSSFASRLSCQVIRELDGIAMPAAENTLLAPLFGEYPAAWPWTINLADLTGAAGNAVFHLAGYVGGAELAPDDGFFMPTAEAVPFVRYVTGNALASARTLIGTVPIPASSHGTRIYRVGTFSQSTGERNLYAIDPDGGGRIEAIRSIPAGSAASSQHGFFPCNLLLRGGNNAQIFVTRDIAVAALVGITLYGYSW